MPIAGSLSIERFEVSRNGMVQLWDLNANLSGKKREVFFVRRCEVGTKEHDPTKVQKKSWELAVFGPTIDRPRARLR